MFPGAAAESEARLSNQEIREQFLTRIFTWARFREARKKGQMRDLISFHAHHKFLLMTYAQNDLVSLGHLVANQDKKKPGSVFGSYERLLRKALRRPPSAPSAINVLMHGFGYFSKKLLREERQFFLNTLEEYRREQIPLSVPISLLRSYAVRFNEAYINQQVFLRPFPETLLELRDSRRGR